MVSKEEKKNFQIIFFKKMSGVPKSKTEFFTKQKLEKIRAENPNAQVLEYTFGKPKREFTAKEQEGLINFIDGQVKAWRDARPGIKTNTIRNWLIGIPHDNVESPMSKSEWGRKKAEDIMMFRDDHANIFKRLTDPHRLPGLMDHLREMLKRRRVKDQQSDVIKNDPTLSKETKEEMLKEIDEEMFEEGKGYLQTANSRSDVTVKQMGEIDDQRREREQNYTEAIKQNKI